MNNINDLIRELKCECECLKSVCENWKIAYELLENKYKHLESVCKSLKISNQTKLTEPNKVLKNPYIKVERKKRVSTKERDIEFSKLKDTSIENIMKTMNVSKRTAYMYKEKYEEKVDNKKLIEKYMIEGKSAKEIMELTGLKKSQVYNLIKIIKEAGAKEIKVR